MLISFSDSTGLPRKARGLQRDLARGLIGRTVIASFSIFYDFFLVFLLTTKYTKDCTEFTKKSSSAHGALCANLRAFVV